MKQQRAKGQRQGEGLDSSNLHVNRGSSQPIPTDMYRTLFTDLYRTLITDLYGTLFTDLYQTLLISMGPLGP